MGAISFPVSGHFNGLRRPVKRYSFSTNFKGLRYKRQAVKARVATLSQHLFYEPPHSALELSAGIREWVAPYSARALEGSAIDSCGCAAAVCWGAGAGVGLAAPVCTGRTPGLLRKASHCSFVP